MLNFRGAGNPQGSGALKIPRALRLNASASAYLARTSGPAPTNPDKFTVSFWEKRGDLGNAGFFLDGAAQPTVRFEFNAADQFYVATGNPSTVRMISNPLYRDPTAHAHIHFVYDAANATPALRCRIWYNGVEVTDWGTDSRNAIAAGQNASGWNGISKANWIGRNGLAAQNYFDGYLSDFYNIDGQALDPTAFGAVDLLTGAWVPIRYAGTYGAQGFHLDFADNSAATSAAIGKDRSGNGNDWTPTGISVAADETNDSVFDTPTSYDDGVNVHSNYPTLSNVMSRYSIGTLSRGGMQVAAPGGSGVALASFVITPEDANIYYFEMKQVAASDMAIGLSPVNPTNASAGYATGEANRGIQYRSDGKVWSLNVTLATYAAFTAGETVGLAVQGSTGKVWLVDKTGAVVFSGAPVYTFTPRELVPSVSGTIGSAAVNFGQQPFKYPLALAALGAKRMCALSLPIPAKIAAKPISYVGAALPIVITGLGFRPYALLLKQSTAVAGRLFVDINGKPTEPWDTDLGTARLAAVAGVSFDADGFTLPGNVANISTTGGIFTAFALGKGAAEGIDIVTWIGNGLATQDVPHGLGTLPDAIFARGSSAAIAGTYTETPGWFRPYSDPDMIIGWGNLSNSGTGDATYFTGTVSATTFQVGSKMTAAGVVYVALLFSNRPGALRVCTYLGSISAGVRLPLGFKPSILMAKKINPTGTGVLGCHIPAFATADPNPNPSGPNMFSNDVAAPIATAIDRWSDGALYRTADGTLNTAGSEYGLIAFAARAAKYARAG